jgi:hypothetical protein
VGGHHVWWGLAKRIGFHVNYVPYAGNLCAGGPDGKGKSCAPFAHGSHPFYTVTPRGAFLDTRHAIPFEPR